MSSAAQAVANRENTNRSTGPRTESGKAVSRLNALRHGATSKAVVLPGEDPAEYERFEKALLADLRPATAAETTQAQRVASLSWRLQRMYDMESSVLAHCMDQVNAETFADAAALFTEPENDRKLRLFHRYLTSAERAYNKALKDYRDLQKENREYHSEQVRMEMWRIASEENAAASESSGVEAPEPADFASRPEFVSQSVVTLSRPAATVTAARAHSDFSAPGSVSKMCSAANL